MESRYITPVVTVFDDKGRVDLEQNLHVYDSLKGKVSGFVTMGSTGEFFALNMQNSKALIELCGGYQKEGMHVYAGASRLDVNESIELANFAYEQEIDGVMIISPYYFPLDDEGVYRFYSTIAEKTPAKIFIYNFPERTGYSVSPEVCLRLADKYTNIVGLKDTIPDTSHTAQVIETVKSRLPHFEVYAGYDNNFAHVVLSGGSGCIGGLSNIFPQFFASWMQAFAQGDLALVAKYQQRVDQLMAIYGVNTPFIPTFKKALQLKGVINSGHCTSPFIGLNSTQTEQLQQLLALADAPL
ncbi:MULTISPECIES: dihydrodipicolinate synthase family protein [Providencia]|uniref:dihydrodipicolinate synthase family protein n=1 Tax=Providencia TaxID=586 RepID=UPI001012C3A3|nr:MULTISPECIES: dihydrodipicolinate synthase family protein [Providencia]EMA4784469.1 dihydrodipicolinate synthase family protein [Providencia rettgeri]MBQ0438382.1 dihydrodipicolinate synthase family protein [Providencia rettgeri]MBX6968896.1 dihydrodipicolinate synthase family protein [Providencia rettgeri]MBX6977562.1 dihydrodipicolinate synthase family protein [Providencia rettgeri]MBX6994630.1 dihydrodipicolinate synthase family protein [Providencia rettgeri]